MSTYPKEGDHEDVYDSGCSPANVCELVRMSVHKDYRGKRLGQRLCQQVDQWAIANGMKRIALSTLMVMEPARALYRSMGYRLRKETEIPLNDVLGEGTWDRVTVAHFIKEVSAAVKISDHS
eukprot:CAMPEP_0184305702 /NCGR_PEP_ID=MMETSP1049-20130417/14913_1 /TAXON_ID=77928 /ORGANISM="Proteomonas sulcata, Strain CCMP704" /LENGTH=121 /DNA_ID=CAMNT_0026617827 /DNA_START=303 /DNA_END=668 /DNA_ORIENTATION=+